MRRLEGSIGPASRMSSCNVQEGHSTQNRVLHSKIAESDKCIRSVTNPDKILDFAIKKARFRRRVTNWYFTPTPFTLLLRFKFVVGPLTSSLTKSALHPFPSRSLPFEI